MPSACIRGPHCPNEIYLEIFHHTTYPSRGDCIATWSNLSLVCRSFLQLIRPIMFETFLVKPDESAEKDPLTTGGIAFCVLLKREQRRVKRLAIHVKALILDLEMISCDPKGELTTICLESLAKFPNLGSVSLQQIVLNAKVFQELRKVNRLTSVSVSGMWTSNYRPRSRQTGQMKQFFSSSHIKSLSIDIEPKGSPELNGDSLPTFPGNIRRFAGWMSPYSVRTLKAHPSLTQLEILGTLETDQAWPLVSFLRNCDSLEELCLNDVRIRHKAIAQTDWREVGQAILPNLRRLRCPPWLARDLIRTSLERLELTGCVIYSPNDFRNRIYLGSSPPLLTSFGAHMPHLAEVAVPIFLFDAVAFSQAYPKLRHVEVLCYHPNLSKAWHVSPGRDRCIEMIRRVSVPCKVEWLSLAVDLELDGWGEHELDLPLHHQIIKDVILRAFPTLVRVSVSRYVVWRQDVVDGWRGAVEDDMWARHLPVNKPRANATVPWKDYKGCLQGLQ